MLRIQPMCIMTDSVDHYRVRFEDKNGMIEDYTFSLTWTGEVGVLNSDQREFYFATYDDPATKLLLKAIDFFDEARRCELRGAASIKPLCLMADQPRPVDHDNPLVDHDNRYKVRFQTEGGEVECGITIQDVDMENLTFPLLVGDTDFLDITNGDPAADLLRKSIFALHEARHFQYAEGEPKPAADIRSSQSGIDVSKRASA